MPHLVIEYAAELEHRGNIRVLMQRVHEAAAATGIMQAGDIKVRATPYAHYQLAGQRDAFIHITCRLLAGRTAAQKTRLAETLRDAVDTMLPDVHSISIDIVDMDPEAYKKRLLP